MSDFSIELKAEEIYAPKTKEYFNEVLKSYYNGSYRSSVVMLYSIVICDLVYKLESAKDIFQDETAINILEEISDMQQSNPSSPTRESSLIDKVKDRTNLFSIGQYDNIVSLKMQRNLAAHPVMSSNYILFKPNKETVRSLIRNTMEAVLLKTPLNISKNIFDDFIVYVKDIKNEFTDDFGLFKHLENKYLRDMSEEVENGVFKSLRKIALKLEGDIESENRSINTKVLRLLLSRNPSKKIEIIGENSDFYSSIPPPLIENFLEILFYFPLIYSVVNPEVHSLIAEYIRKDANIRAKSFFISDSLEEHIEIILSMDPYNEDQCTQKEIELNTILKIYNQCIKQGEASTGRLFLINYFGKSASYARADSRFDELIDPFLSEFTEHELVILIGKIGSNPQIYDRNQARHTNAKVKYSLDALNEEFDYSEHTRFTG